MDKEINEKSTEVRDNDNVKQAEIVNLNEEYYTITNLVKRQVEANSKEKKNHYSLEKEKLDIKLQLERSKNLMDMKRIATIHLEDGKAYLTSSIVYTNTLGIIARPVLKKKIDKAVIVDEINEVIYPNGDTAPLLVMEDANVRTVRIKNTVEDTLKKEYKDFQDSFDLLEKRFLAVRLANLGNDKWALGIVLAIGLLMGFFLSKTLRL